MTNKIKDKLKKFKESGKNVDEVIQENQQGLRKKYSKIKKEDMPPPPDKRSFQEKAKVIIEKKKLQRRGKINKETKKEEEKNNHEFGYNSSDLGYESDIEESETPKSVPETKLEIVKPPKSEKIRKMVGENGVTLDKKECNDIKNTIIEFLTGIPIKMINVQRFAGTHQLFNENVAQHCHQVAMICWVLARVEKELGSEVNLGALLTNAIFHDMEEVLGADLNHHFKKFDNQFKRLYEEVSYGFTFKNFYSILFFKDELSDKVCKYKNEKTIEGKILSVADMLQLIGKSIIEIDSGNIEFFSPFWTGYIYLKKPELSVVKGLKFVFPYFDEKIKEWEERFGEERVHKKNRH